MNNRTIRSLKGKSLRKTEFYGHAIPYLEYTLSLHDALPI